MCVVHCLLHVAKIKSNVLPSGEGWDEAAAATTFSALTGGSADAGGLSLPLPVVE